MTMHTIASLTPTLCSLLGIRVPDICTEPPIQEVIDHISNGQSPRRALIYAPDAIGAIQRATYPNIFTPLYLDMLNIPVESMRPPKTPVCYASIFTGAMPGGHGIKTPVRHLLECETLFDVLLEAGLSVGVSPVSGSSVDILFRERAMTYRPGEDDDTTNLHAHGLMTEATNDVVVVYNQRYDDLVHAGKPFGNIAEEAMRGHVTTFMELIESARRSWDCPFVAIFAPDHGAHVTDEGGGDHGLDIPEDMEVIHTYAFRGVG